MAERRPVLRRPADADRDRLSVRRRGVPGRAGRTLGLPRRSHRRERRGSPRQLDGRWARQRTRPARARQRRAGPGLPGTARARSDPATATKLEAEARTIVDTAAEFGVELLWQDTGRTLDRRPSTEHFGFRDGVSQPGVRGQLPESKPRRYLTPRQHRNRMPQDWPEFAAPGTPLIWPGSFVFGYPAQNPLDARAPGPTATAGPPWADNGSLSRLPAAAAAGRPVPGVPDPCGRRACQARPPRRDPGRPGRAPGGPLEERSAGRPQRA